MSGLAVCWDFGPQKGEKGFHDEGSKIYSVVEVLSAIEFHRNPEFRETASQNRPELKTELAKFPPDELSGMVKATTISMRDLRQTVSELAREFRHPHGGGRPHALDRKAERKAQKLIRYFTEDQDESTKDAIERTANRFKTSRRTIERIWAKKAD